MRKAVPILVMASAALAVVITFACIGIYQITHAAPQFYQDLLAQDVETQKQASDEFVQQTLTLVSDIQQQGHWQTAFTDEQINGWLAVDVPQNLPDAIPPEISNPRVRIRPGEATIACQLKTDKIDAVVSLTVNVFVSAPNEVATRFRRATIGSLPVPMGNVIEPIGQAAAQLDLRMTWRQQEGDPVAVILLDEDASEERRGLALDAIELGDGELLIAGRNRKREEKLEPVAQEDQPPTKAASAAKTKRQR